jgi:hypothetical protein
MMRNLFFGELGFQLMALLSAQHRAKGEGFLADLSRLVT